MLSEILDEIVIQVQIGNPLLEVIQKAKKVWRVN